MSSGVRSAGKYFSFSSDAFGLTGVSATHILWHSIEISARATWQLRILCQVKLSLLFRAALHHVSSSSTICLKLPEAVRYARKPTNFIKKFQTYFEIRIIILLRYKLDKR